MGLYPDAYIYSPTLIITEWIDIPNTHTIIFFTGRVQLKWYIVVLPDLAIL